MPEFSSLSYQAMKAELKERGLSTKGKKAVLLQRLEESAAAAEAPVATEKEEKEEEEQAEAEQAEEKEEQGKEEADNSEEKKETAKEAEPRPLSRRDKERLAQDAVCVAELEKVFGRYMVEGAFNELRQEAIERQASAML